MVLLFGYAKQICHLIPECCAFLLCLEIQCGVSELLMEKSGMKRKMLTAPSVGTVVVCEGVLISMVVQARMNTSIFVIEGEKTVIS